MDNNVGDDLNEIEDMDAGDKEINHDDDLHQKKEEKGANNKEAEVLDIDDIPDFE